MSKPYTLLVGGPDSPSPEKDAVAFYVHADLLLNISPFFRAAFEAKQLGYAFQEAATGTMRLPEERPDDFRFLLQWLYWKYALRLAGLQYKVSMLSHEGSVLADLEYVGGLWHEKIEPPLKIYREYKAEKKLLKKAAVHGDISQLIMPRPPPPMFGPLIRLYILADRYDIGDGLREEIVQKFRWLGCAGSCVPGREDVRLLWNWVVGADRLKEVVLQMYAGLKGKGFGRVFLGNDTENGEGWHLTFVTDLLIVMFSKQEEKRKQTPDAAEGELGKEQGSELWKTRVA